MKKFLIYILSITAIIIAALYVSDIIYTWGYQHGTPRNKISHLMQRKNDTIDYIFIGSSRVDNTINADIITSITGKSAINLGIQSAKIDDYLIILKLLKDQNIKSEQIFIQIDYVYNMKGNSEILKSEFMPFINNEVIKNALKDKDPEYYRLKYIPFYRYLKYDYKIGFREFFNSAIGNKNNIDLRNGYFAKFGSSGKDFTFSLPSHIIKENKHINTINKFAKENHLSIIYFIAPFCPDTKNLDFAIKLREKLPVFLDYSNIFTKEENFFFNCSHLNNKGATEFSKLFANDILNMENK